MRSLISYHFCDTYSEKQEDYLDTAPDEWFSHLAIEVPGENGSNEWLEPVSDEEYGKLQ